jgi:hypothetical protein
VFTFIVGLPTLIGTYYQAWKARQEARQARNGFAYSENCLEFIRDDGTTVNLVPLSTLHTLPKPGDVVLLPGRVDSAGEDPRHAAYRVGRIEFIYARVENRHAQPGQARLAKAVAHVDGLTTGAWEAAAGAKDYALTASDAVIEAGPEGEMVFRRQGDWQNGDAILMPSGTVIEMDGAEHP